jgi:hypothetical protein
VKRALVVFAIALLGIVCAGALSAGRACAHDPRFVCSPRDAQRPVVVADPQKSWAFYGRLDAEQQDRYVVDTPRAVAVPVQLLIDRRDAANPARPVAAIADAGGRAIATVDLTQSHSFFEPFSRVTYLESPERLIRFPAGRSTIAVAMRGGEQSQRYTLAIGSDERFSPWEMPYLLGAVYRIHAQEF